MFCVEYKRHGRVGNDRRNDSTCDNSNGRRGNYKGNRSNSDVCYDGRTGSATSHGRFAEVENQDVAIYMVE